MTYRPKRLMVVFGFLILLCTLSMLGLGWWAAADLVHPARRPLQDYHQEILKHPAQFGLKISSYSVPAAKADGYAAPCLLCEPNASEGLGTRGKVIREQLTAKGIPLLEFGKTCGTVVLLHGRGGRKEDGLPIAERFCAAGLRCILIDLPAHGDNLNPVASFGLHEWDLPNQAVLEATRQFGVPARPRALWGLSQGGSVAVYAAAHGSWDALVVLSSFTTLADVCKAQAHRYVGPLATPLYWTTEPLVEWQGGYGLSQVRPIDCLKQLTLPVLIGHGTADELIPLSTGRAIYEAVGSKDKQFVAVDGGTHERVLVTPMPLYAEMAAFLVERLRSDARDRS